MRQLLLALQPTAELRQQRLLLSVLGAVPALWTDYVRAKGVGSLLEPRPTRSWLCSVAFACRLLRTAPPDAVAPRFCAEGGGSGAETEAEPTLLPVALDLLLPPAVQRSFWSRALLHAHPVVRCSTL